MKKEIFSTKFRLAIIAFNFTCIILVLIVTYLLGGWRFNNNWQIHDLRICGMDSSQRIFTLPNQITESQLNTYSLNVCGNLDSKIPIRMAFFIYDKDTNSIIHQSPSANPVPTGEFVISLPDDLIYDQGNYEIQVYQARKVRFSSSFSVIK